ncbi:MAG: hypothetical protein Q8P93_04430 [bacterium]|nr:hypothetical protein [bacterium]
MFKTAEEFHAVYSKLPERIKDAANSERTTHVVEALVEKYKLHIDQGGKLTDVISKVFFGMIRPEEFSSHLAEALDISRTMANEITKDVNEAIFIPIRRELQELHEKEREELVNAIEDTGVPQPVEVPAEVINKEEIDKGDLLREIENPGVTVSSNLEHVEEKMVVTPPKEPAAVEDNQPPRPSILDRKRTEPFNPAVAAKERINSDPYKESL